MRRADMSGPVKVTFQRQRDLIITDDRVADYNEVSTDLSESHLWLELIISPPLSHSSHIRRTLRSAM